MALFLVRTKAYFLGPTFLDITFLDQKSLDSKLFLAPNFLTKIFEPKIATLSLQDGATKWLDFLKEPPTRPPEA